MKNLFYIIILTLVFCCSNSKNEESNETNSDCQNSEHEFICWTIVDESTRRPIKGASINLIWGSAFGNFISGDSTDEGLICFCWRNNWDVISGGISAENYKWMDLTGINPVDISRIRLFPSN